MEIGAGLAKGNSIVSIGVLIIGLRSRLIRIRAEEEMLVSFLTEEYQAYQSRTWKLVAFVY